MRERETRWVGSVSALAKNPGEIAGNKTIKPRLRRLAKKLVPKEEK